MNETETIYRQKQAALRNALLPKLLSGAVQVKDCLKR